MDVGPEPLLRLFFLPAIKSGCAAGTYSLRKRLWPEQYAGYRRGLGGCAQELCGTVLKNKYTGPPGLGMTLYFFIWGFTTEPYFLFLRVPDSFTMAINAVESRLRLERMSIQHLRP